MGELVGRCGGSGEPYSFQAGTQCSPGRSATSSLAALNLNQYRGWLFAVLGTPPGTYVSSSHYTLREGTFTRKSYRR